MFFPLIGGSTDKYSSPSRYSHLEDNLIVTTSRTIIPNSPSELKRKSRSVINVVKSKDNTQGSPEFPKSTFGAQKVPEAQINIGNELEDLRKEKQNFKEKENWLNEEMKYRDEIVELNKKNRQLEDALDKVSMERSYQRDNESTMIKERIINNDLNEKIRDLQQDYEKVMNTHNHREIER